MDKAFVETHAEDRGVMAGKLIKMAVDLGHPVWVVETYNHGFIVPVDVAQALAAEAEEPVRVRPVEDVKLPAKKPGPKAPAKP